MILTENANEIGIIYLLKAYKTIIDFIPVLTDSKIPPQAYENMKKKGGKSTRSDWLN